MDEKTVLEALKETENLMYKFGYSALPPHYDRGIRQEPEQANQGA